MNKGLRFQYFIAVLFGIALTIVSFIIHIHPSFNSMINFKTKIYNTTSETFSDDYIDVVKKYHKEHPVFSRRPLTTFFVEETQSLLGISVAKAFSVFNFLLIFLSGLLVFYLSKLLNQNFLASIISQLLYHTSFTIFFPFFRTIYTYDEPFQYFFCFLSVIAIIKNYRVFLTVCLVLSLIARESSVVMFPSFLLLSYYLKTNQFKIKLPEVYKVLLPFVISVLVYMVFYFYHVLNFIPVIEQDYDEVTTRFSQLSFNFQNLEYTIESISVFIIINALPVTLLLYNNEHRYKAFIKSFILAIILNTLMVYVSARVCESRVLTLPLLIIFPFLGNGFIKFIYEFKTLIRGGKKIRLIIFLILSIALSYLLSFKIYSPTGSLEKENWFNEYFFIVLIISFMIFITHKLSKSQTKSF